MVEVASAAAGCATTLSVPSRIAMLGDGHLHFPRNFLRRVAFL